MTAEQVSHANGTARQSQLQKLQRVYCRGELLHEVQMQELFEDCKHFVDMPIKANSSVDTVLSHFQELKASFDPETNKTEWKAQLAGFVKQHFDPPDSELRPFTPLDYVEGAMPQKIKEIANTRLREWAMELHKLWKVLARVPASSSADKSARSSFLHSLPIIAAPDEPQSALARPSSEQNVIVVPGGRFSEFYYWDTYWIVQGLLVSGLHQTARSIVRNLLEYVAEFGFVPNGGRIYYLTRSQPPMLSDMVRVVAKIADEKDTDDDPSTWDLQFLRAAVPLLEREYTFWMERGTHGHAVEICGSSGEPFVLNRYVANANEPRPESYREDVHTASTAFGAQSGGSDNVALYNDIIAAAESGWDFSSRWFFDYNTLPTIRTSRVLPVDLNAVLHRVERNIAHFHELLGNDEASTRFHDAVNNALRDVLQAVVALHRIEWIHRDVRWSNVLKQRKVNLWFLIDFANAATSPQPSLSGQHLSQEEHAPEIFVNGGIHTTAVDIWAEVRWMNPAKRSSFYRRLLDQDPTARPSRFGGACSSIKEKARN